MKTLILILLLLSSFAILLAENKVSLENTIEEDSFQNISFRAQINPLVLVSFKDQQVKGLLMGMEADSVIIKIKEISSDSSIQRISINEIYHIREIRKSKFGKHLVYGLLIGAGTGVIIGLLSGDDPPGWFQATAEEKAFAAGSVLGLGGGLIGAITSIGSGQDLKYDLSELRYLQKVQVISELSGY